MLNAQITTKEASSAIDKVVHALQKDKAANEELGRLRKTNNVLGFGSPHAGIIAVQFNASFQKDGFGHRPFPYLLDWNIPINKRVVAPWSDKSKPMYRCKYR